MNVKQYLVRLGLLALKERGIFSKAIVLTFFKESGKYPAEYRILNSECVQREPATAHGEVGGNCE